MKNLKSEKGSVATLVIVTVLFFVAILSSAYMIVATLRKGQLKNQLSVKETYEKDLSRVDEIVAEFEKVPQIDIDTIAEENGTINGKKPNYKNPIIPEGYKPVNEGDATWDGEEGPKINEGLVIEDANKNQYVWIPMPTADDVYVKTADGEEKTLIGTNVKTNIYSKSEIILEQYRTYPGDTDSSYFREPDLVVGGGSIYDAKEEYYKLIMGKDGTKASLAQFFVDEYKAMINSLTKYEGFYLGRYELSGDKENPKEQSGTVLTNTNWYELYNACRKLAASSAVETQMVWGCQWDIVCNWLAENGYDIVNSCSWGNYDNSTGNAAVLNEKGKKAYGDKQITGYSEFWKANNLYDLAGNCQEWTQEADSDGSDRVERGGKYSEKGDKYPVTCKEPNSPDHGAIDSRTSRAVIMVK